MSNEFIPYNGSMHNLSQPLGFYWFHDNVERDLLAWPRTQTDRSKLLLDRNQTLNPQEASCTEPSFINYVSGR
jgi:hypothetical protein